MSFLLMLLLTLTARCVGETPAMKLVLTDKALQYGARLGGWWMHRQIAAASIPAVTGSVRITRVLGHVDYVLDGMSARCRSPDPSVRFDESAGGLRAAVSGLDVWVNGNWRTHYGLIHDHGTFRLSLSNVHVSSRVRLGRGPAGHLTVASTSCSAGIEGLTIDFDGGGSLLFQPFVREQQGRIKSQIEEQICPAIAWFVQDLQRQLAAKPVSIMVRPTLVMEVPLTSAPAVHSSSLGLDLKGEFYHAQKHAEPPFRAKPFILTPQSNYMLQFGFSEFAVNSASYVYFSGGFLRARINDSMIPKASPVRLNTTSFGAFIPQLPKMFPNMLMELHADAREVPMFRFVSDMVELDVLAVVKAFAICPNKTLIPLFKLSVDASFGLKLFFSQGKVKGSATMSNFTMALVSSEVGGFQIAVLKNVVKTAVQMVALPKVNAMLSQGVAIPSLHNIKLVNPVLLVNEGFVVIASDVKI